MKQKRIVYGETPWRSSLVTENPGKVFAIIGPFDNFSHSLMTEIEDVVRAYNDRVAP